MEEAVHAPLVLGAVVLRLVERECVCVRERECVIACEREWCGTPAQRENRR
jgi:hypothetical protein